MRKSRSSSPIWSQELIHAFRSERWSFRSSHRGRNFLVGLVGGALIIGGVLPCRAHSAGRVRLLQQEQSQAVRKDNPREKPSEVGKEQGAEEKKADAFLLVQEILEEAERIADPPQRLRIRIQAADLLWALDERAGRSLFERVMGEIVRLEVKTESERGQAKIEPRRALLRELLSRAVRRDARFAERLIERFEGEAQRSTSGLTREALYQEMLGILWDASAGEPTRDVSLLADVVSRALSSGHGIPSVVSLLLTSAATSSPDVGDTLFRVVFSRFATLPEDSALAILGAYLSRRFRAADSLAPLEQEARTIFARALARAESLWRQARADQAMALQRETHRFIQSLGSDYLPLFQKFEDPTRVALLTLYAQALARALSVEQRPARPMSEAEGTVDEQMQEIEREPHARMRDRRLRELALKSPAEQARKVAEKISNPKMREVTLEELKIRQVVEQVAHRQLEDAQRTAGTLSDFGLRSRAFIEIARTFLKTGQQEEPGRTLLERAYQEALRAARTARRAECLFEIAGLYAPLDSARAFHLLMEASKAAGEAEPEEHVTARDEAFGGILYEPGKLSLTYRPDVDEIDLPSGLILLAREDFYRMRLVSWSIRSPVLRSRFLLILAQWLVEEATRAHKDG